MNIWLVTLLLGVLTLFGRTSFIIWFSHWEMPVAIQKALRFVPAAAFSAIVAPAILRPEGALDLSLLNPNLIAALVTIGVAWYSRSIILIISAGMVTLWLALWTF
ncbi:MAG: AzlD domain-containing protein [Chloroflexota bacterium]